MKKTLLSLGLLLSMSTSLRAQTAYVLVPVRLVRPVIHYGVFGSFASSHYTASSSEDYTFRDLGSRTGAGGGVFMDFFFSRRVAFTFGLNKADRGGTFSAVYNGSTNFSNAIPSVSATYELRTSYVYLPLGLKVFTGDPMDRVRFYGQALFSSGFLTSATNYGSPSKSYTRTYSTGPRTSKYDYVKHVGLLDEEVSLGLGAEARLSKKFDAFAGVRYGYGVTSAQGTPLDFLQEIDFHPRQDAYPLHNVALTFEAGIVFVPYRGKDKTVAPPAEPNNDPRIQKAFQRAPGLPVATQ
jgi:hypothetical protein